MRLSCGHSPHEAAAAVIREAVGRTDDALVARVGAEYVAHTRATLASLIAGEAV